MSKHDDCFIMVSYKIIVVMLNTIYRKYGEIYQTPHRVTLIENGTDLDRYKEIYKDKDKSD